MNERQIYPYNTRYKKWPCHVRCFDKNITVWNGDQKPGIKITLFFYILDNIWMLETKSSRFKRKTLWLNKIKNNNNTIIK